MIKVIFCLQTMTLGGMEKELINILKKFDYSKYDITLLLLYVADEEILSELPQNVKIVNLNIDREYYCSGLKTMVKSRLKKGEPFDALSITVKWLLNIGACSANTSLDSIPSVEEFFDIAVCYHIHSPIMLKYVAAKVNAKKRIGWIHNDFSNTGYPIQNLTEYLSEYDEIVAVSGGIKDEFTKLCHDYSGKVSVANNIVDEDEIHSLSLQIPDDAYFEDKHIKLLSVGRFSHEKGFDIAIEIANVLKDKGTDFHWYLIGHGEEEQLYRKLIRDYQLEDTFIILGKKTNPYPYIANCDIYVQPSLYETFGLVINEAKTLKRPVVCSAFASADEQIDNGNNGYIVPVEDRKSFTDQLEKLILDKDERMRLEKNLQNYSAGSKDLEIIMSKFSI